MSKSSHAKHLNTFMSADVASQALELVKQGRAELAITLIEAASPSTPMSESAVRAYAVALAQVGRCSQAAAALEPLLLNPSVALQTRALAARVFEDAGRMSEAFAQYEEVLRSVPTQAAFWKGLLRAALASRSAATCRKAIEAAAALRFDLLSEETIACLALKAYRGACEARSEVDQAFAFADIALRRFPQGSKIYSLVARLAMDMRPIGAIEWLQARAGLKPAVIDVDAMNAALAMPQLFADERAINHWRESYREALVTLIQACDERPKDALELVQSTAFSLAYHGRNDVELQSLRGDLLSRAVAVLAPRAANARDPNDASIRVGFASKHLRDCTVGHYFRRFITDLADDEVDVYTYACGVFDQYTEQIEQGVTTARRFPLAEGDDLDESVLARIARMVAADELDVLIFPEIGMEPLIERLASMRLAPLQCALWGHPVTTGLPTIDVFFSSEMMEPEGFVEHYRERIHVLPGLGCAYPVPPKPEALNRSQLGLPEDAPLLVCAQSSFKWSAAFVDVIGMLLRERPTAKLVCFRNRDNVAALAFEDFLEQRFSAFGVELSSRVIVMQETSRPRFLAVLAACDVALDTFGFSGGNTTLDSLSVGLPVVTLPGEFMRGRQSRAMLQLIGANELIAQDEADFLRIAGDLLSNRAARGALRVRLRDSAAKLFDDPAPIEAFRRWILASRHST